MMMISIIRWFFLIRGLRKRGSGIKESGAFLVAKSNSNKVSKIVYYDELDTNVSDTGIIVFNGLGHGKLAEVLEEYSGKVIADIHTHPGSNTNQSSSDQRHPMSRLKGHIAIIAPNYAENWFLSPKLCSVYMYLGSFKWKPLKAKEYNIKLTLI
jgi:hypothetical protein